MRPCTLTAAGLVATLALTACTEAGPGAVAAVPEPEPGDSAVYAPDGWPLQIGDVPSGKELRDLSDRFGIWRSGFAPAPTLVEGRMHVARYAFDNTYLGHFPETFPDVLRPYEAELPPEFRGKVEYHRTPPRPPRRPHTDDGIVWVRLDENGRFVQVVSPRGAASQPEPCRRSAARSFPSGTVTELDDRDAPCRVVFRPTGVRLEALVDGSRPDPGTALVRDGTGRYYSANARGFLTIISVWSPDGAFVSHFGGTGEGPGEFPRTGSVLALYVDGHNQLHVWAPGSWSVFSPDHEFLRRHSTIGANTVLSREQFSAVLDNGDVLTGSGRELSDGRNFFRILRPDGTLARAFGPVGSDVVRNELPTPEKLISYGGGDTFWAAANRPLTADWQGWIAEQWTLDGELRWTVRRRVPGYRMFEANGNVSGATGFLHADDEAGLLYVVFGELTRRGRERARDPARITIEERRGGLITLRFEVVDLRSGELLASDVHRAEDAETFMPRGLFRGAMEGYLYRETDEGLPLVEIVAVDLVAK